MPVKRYERKRLTERQWHKIVMHDERGLGSSVNSLILSKCKGETMYHNGGSWHLAFVELDEDIEFIRDICRMTDKDYRGKGNWAKHKYNCAKSNRMP